MRALTIRQPWAELIIGGRKRYELRSRRTHIRGRIWMHAGRTVEDADAERAGLDPTSLPRGVLLGTAELVGCSPFTPEMADEMRRARIYFGDWEDNLFAWEMSSPRRLPEPIPWKGSLSWFDVPGLPSAPPYWPF